MKVRSGRIPRIERRLAADDTPAGFQTAVGAVAVVVAALIAACLPAAAPAWRLVPVVAAVLAMGVVARHLWALVAVGVLAVLVVDGFLVNRFGELTWHGRWDAYRLLVIAAAAGLGRLLGALHRWRRRPPPLTLPAGWSVIADDRRAATRINKEESPRG